MENNKKKAVAIFDFNALLHEPAGIKIKNLLNILIDETRLDNDNVSPEQLPRNQGKIEGWRQLSDYLERGLPTPLK